MECYPFDKNECEMHTDNRSEISVKEKGRKYLANNIKNAKVCLIRVDDCLIKDGIRCDFLLLNCDSKEAYFIELKGKDILHAVEQIDRTIDILYTKISNYKVNVRIVFTKVDTPNLIINKYKKLKDRVKKMGGNIIKSKNILKEKI